MYSSEIVKKSPWDKLNIARDKNRPNARFYIENIFNDFLELHGDRYYKDDSAIIGGIASINNINVTVIGINKGKDTLENINIPIIKSDNFGHGLLKTVIPIGTKVRIETSNKAKIELIEGCVI